MATIFRAGPCVHQTQHFATVALFFCHIKTILVLGPINVRSMRPIPFPSALMLPTHPVSASQNNAFDYVATSQHTAHIRPPVPVLFFANFRFAGIVVLPWVIYPFFVLRVFTAFFLAFPGGRPLLRFGCAFCGAFRAILSRFCSIFVGSCAISGGFCSIGWLHQKNVPVPVL